MRVVMMFIDGVGLGKEEMNNPFWAFPTPRMRGLLDGLPFTLEAAGFHENGVLLSALDATLGIEGLPQSATGQTSLFTGVNAAALLGYHLRGFPNEPLKALLRERNLFTLLVRKGKKAAFLNAYRPSFFVDLEKGLSRPFSCTTMMNYYAGLPFRSFFDLQAGKALYADITNAKAQSLGYRGDILEPAEGGKRLISLADDYDFSLFESYITDLAGHRKDRQRSAEVLAVLDAFIGGVVDALNPRDTCFILVSDHGNFEDMASSEHTCNPVPALLIGAGKERAGGLFSITQVAPLVISLLDS